jgi:predicted nuclease of predicted toxin-antitoxin system
MSERAAEVYLDEDVAAVVAPMLRGRGFRATTTLEQSRTGATDVEQVEFAASKGWVLVTHNRADFVRLAAEFAAGGRGHAGIVVLTRRSPRELADRISRVLDRFRPEELRNLLIHA